MSVNYFDNWSWLSTKRNRLILALLSGILLSISWPVNGQPYLIFFALVPILMLDRAMGKDEGKQFFAYTYLALLIWNVATTWWVFNSTPVAIVAFTANAGLLYLPIWAFRITRRNVNDKFAYLALPIYWIAFEYLHLSWQLSWPWLTLGNVFSELPYLVQWYQYTGVLGGSLWIWAANIVAFYFIAALINPKSVFPSMSFVYFVLLIASPIVESLTEYFNYEPQGQPIEVVVVQPNIDPFTQKFAGSDDFIPFDQQLDMFIELSEKKITPKTQLVMWPETALDNQFDLKALDQNPFLAKIKAFRNRHPQIALLTGLTSYEFYDEDNKGKPTSRYAEEYDLYYDIYNTAMFIDQKDQLHYYHKSKLVPGVEIMPYPSIFGILQKLSINLGGTSGGFGRQEERTVFNLSSGYGLAPAICYESIYGDFLSQFIRNGASFIAIITNDGWWGNTAGYKQHFSYARLRAIEFRRSIARSANTGISGFIDQRGDVVDASDWWTQDARVFTIMANEEMTVYAEMGGFLGRIAGFIGIAMLLSAIIRGKTDIFKKTQKVKEITLSVCEIARKVGAFISQERARFDDSNIEYKGHNDLVSYVDKESEKRLVKALSELLPEANILAEEGHEIDNKSKYTWVVDPLDGTTNFLHNLPVYAISIALLEDKKPVVGVVYEVPKSRCFYTWKNGGAYCDEKPISVSKNNALSECIMATGFPYTIFEKLPNYLQIVESFMKGSHGIRRFGSAAIDLAYVASGLFDGFFEYNLNPWDVAAGVLLVQEAGGAVSDFSGKEDYIFGKEILAGNKAHGEMLAVIKEHW